MPANEGRTDEEWLHLLQNGDERALTWLYRRHWESLFLAACQVFVPGSDNNPFFC